MTQGLCDLRGGAATGKQDGKQNQAKMRVVQGGLWGEREKGLTITFASL